MTSRLMILTTILILAFAVGPTMADITSTSRVIIQGTVFDADSLRPIGFATVRVEGTGRSTLANENGQYRLVLSGPNHRLKFSHTSYYSESFDITAADTLIIRDVHLRPAIVDIGTFSVYTRAYDPGQRIIVEAIRRKKDILSRFHDYRYDAYTKFTVTDDSKPDTSVYFLLAESQTTAYWEQPDKYKEIISARRQSANIPAEGNLVTVGEILNFNRNRIDLGRYAVVSPTATDALDYYNYYLLDTLLVDGKQVFRLEIEPKNPNNPLFVGFINIADRTFDVMEVDVGLSKGVDFPMVSNLRYSQRFAQFQDSIWMPVEIRLSGAVELSIPGIPSRLGFLQAASLYEYQFDTGLPEVSFDEYLLEVDKKADVFDSVAWYARQTIPLTDAEVAGYERIDSVNSAPRPILKKAALLGVAGTAFLALGGAPDFFRFNRVEGPYLGLGITPRFFDDRLTVTAKTGYAIDAKRWEHDYGLTYRVYEPQKVDVGVEALNRVVRRPSIIYAGSAYDPTASALGWHQDPFDYYRTKGFKLRAGTKLVDHTRLQVTYTDVRDHSMPRATDFSLFGDDNEPEINVNAVQQIDTVTYDTTVTYDSTITYGDTVMANPAVAEGTLRSLTAVFSYDSRMMIKNKGIDEIADEIEYTLFEAGVEHASPDLFHTDFDFRRYHAELFRQQRMLGLGVSSIWLYVGGSSGTLPPQRYFAVDCGDPMLFGGSRFMTLDNTGFSGNRLAALGLSHDFRRTLWTKSGIPLIRDIPLWLAVHANFAWADLKDHQPQPGDDLVRMLGKPYREVGFSLGNLTPFLAPFNLELTFIWQLSDYDTNPFALGWSIKL
jgi:hypothetical protein